MTARVFHAGGWRFWYRRVQRALDLGLGMVRAIVASSFVALILFSGYASASDKLQKHLEHILKRMDPATRLEQVCDAAAMQRIARDNREFRVDRSVVSALE